ncbi:hypothetical protein ACKW6Q_17795 [Chryseobacterium kwangjuense]|uniref:Uncharacterized protein n=1 Tax=Chryseobacterium kwangjuense TaxID=267125 RepID=A0ABW9K6C7_9FLAO
MSYKIYYILFVFCSLLYSAQDIEVVKITYEEHFDYVKFHNKKTVNHDEIVTSKNISLISNDLEFKNLMKCNNKNCYKVSVNDIIVSSDFILSANLNVKDKLKDVEPFLKDYLNKLVINQNILKKKSDYILYRTELKNVIVITLRMTISYYNTHTGNLKLCGNPDDKILVYRYLNGNDESEIENKSL